MLTKLLALLGAAACALSAGAGAADFGANDDTGKFLAADSAAYFGQLAAVGLETNVMSLKWDPALPEAIPDQLLLDAALPHAEAAGVQIVFALYGARPTAFTGDGGTPEAFAKWAALVARTYPQVRRFVVGNEPNQPRFWRPQFSLTGTQVSAAAFGPVLAATYDALKEVDPELSVIGVGLSPRGNDRPNAPSNVSTSPVRFLKALGKWYRSTGRTRPLMDHLSFHPYPQSSRDSLTTGYAWPNAGVRDLGRIKLAIWDAFAGTAQPTTATGLKLYLDEVGWQVDTSASSAYAGVENVAVTDESAQAAIYGELVRQLGCDPTVAAVNLFGFVDDSERAGFQAGLIRRDGTARPAATVVKETLTQTAGGCLGALTGWRVTKGVVGARGSYTDTVTPAGVLVPSFVVGAREEALYRAGVFRAGVTLAQIERRLASGPPPLRAVRGIVRVNRPLAITLAAKRLPPGRYVYGVRMAAWANPARVSVFGSRPFEVVGPAP